MGGCISLYDEDELKAKELNRQYAREVKEFSDQLRKTRTVYSELDLQGRGMVKHPPVVVRGDVLP